MSLSRFVTFDFRQSASKFSCPIPTPHYFFEAPYLFFAQRSVSAERILSEGVSVEKVLRGGALQQRSTWRWSASAGIVSQSEVVGY